MDRGGRHYVIYDQLRLSDATLRVSAVELEWVNLFDGSRTLREIQTELRSQYVIGFYPPPDAKPGKWRELDVRVSEGKVRTMRGYYP